MLVEVVLLCCSALLCNNVVQCGAVLGTSELHCSVPCCASLCCAARCCVVQYVVVLCSVVTFLFYFTYGIALTNK